MLSTPQDDLEIIIISPKIFSWFLYIFRNNIPENYLLFFCEVRPHETIRFINCYHLSDLFFFHKSAYGINFKYIEPPFRQQLLINNQSHSRASIKFHQQTFVEINFISFSCVYHVVYCLDKLTYLF